MNLKYIIALISLLLLSKCTNSPPDLSEYEKFLYFDEINMIGVGIPTLDQIKAKEFVYVKNDKHDLIEVYYPYKDVLVNYDFKDSLWTSEYTIVHEEIAQRLATIFFSFGDSIFIEYTQVYRMGKCSSSNLCFHKKDFSICIKVDCDLIWTKEKLKNIIKEQVKVEKFKNLKAQELLIKNYYVDNYILYYFIEKGMKNGYLTYATNRSKTPPTDDSDPDTEIFLTKYPEYKYKRNLREF